MGRGWSRGQFGSRGGKSKGRGKSGKGRGKGMVQSSIQKRKKGGFGRGKGFRIGGGGGRVQDEAEASYGRQPRNDCIVSDGHILLLVQYQPQQDSRTFMEFDSIPAAMDGICLMYEQAVKLHRSSEQSINYKVEELWQFLDELNDIACMVYDREGGDYHPNDRAWIKREVLEHLKGQLPAPQQ
mmetsp:Transcript_47858/g.84253  ORF Transcript_47858/g.84253 Transcript_47858/m.84253 type:complete len:183 (-) Transcript_47858:17-565(-)